MDIMAEQKRVSWDQLKQNLAQANYKEAGTPGSREFEDYSAKLEKTRNERLQQQEDSTKRLLKHMNKGRGHKKEKKEKKKGDKGDKGDKRAAVDAGSSSDGGEDEDALLVRYKKA